MQRLAIVLTLALTAASAQTQKSEPPESNEPSYEQTQKWITSKTSETGFTRKTNNGSDTASYDAVSLNDCRLVYTQTEFNSSSIPVPSGVDTMEYTAKWESAIPLEKVTASDIMVKHRVEPKLGMNEWSVDINSRVGTLKMTKTERGVVGEEIQNYSNIGAAIIFGRSASTDESTANRMQKALTHAVTLCKTLKAKEPF